jgi:nitronate monooxygenase
MEGRHSPREAEVPGMLRTYLTTTLGFRHPVVNAPMTPAAGGALARAVADAGGVGMIGLDYRDAVDAFADEVALLREGDTQRRFGVGLTAWSLALRPELFAAALAAKPFLIAISFGDVAPFARAVHDAGILLAAQVQDRDSALAAQAAGVDILVAQGTEAGGHTGDVGTLPLLQVVLAQTTLPVIAAGGIATGRGLAAVLAAGAQGAWVGTPFLLADEARVPDAARARIVAARENETVLTSLFDRVQGMPWPARYRGRALANDFTRRWHGHEEEVVHDSAALDAFAQAKAGGRYDVAHQYAGQSVGLMTATAPARAIVEALAADGERVLRERAAALLAP